MPRRPPPYLHAVLLLVASGSPALAADAPFDPAPWVGDLQQMRSAFAEKYANFEWAVFEREADVSALFDQAEARIKASGDDAGAKAAIDRLVRTLGDGHVQVVWPARRAPGEPGPAERPVCEQLGYDAAKGGIPLAPHVPGYRPLRADSSGGPPVGTIAVGRRRVGVIRLGLFGPKASPALCVLALKTLGISSDGTCDDRCAQRIEEATYAELSRELAADVRALQVAKATVLLVDITGNGGGSEWAEAAARIVSPVRLRSERLGFVRGSHWADRWATLASALSRAAEQASPQDGVALARWAEEARGARAEAMKSCPSAPFWSGRRPDCEWLGHGFFATGILGEADARALREKPWGPLVFSPAQYEFKERVWHGPLMVVVDGNTASAAEEFAAVLQDNRAAVIVGAPTAGAGCGHTDGGTPTKLLHSGGVLELPDCARLRSDGSNEVAGITPTILVGFRSNDGLRRKGLRLQAALPEAVEAADRLWKRGRPFRDRAQGSPPRAAPHP